jgi:hypothetical protein
MKVQLQNVRLAFPALFEPKQVQGQGEAKFSASFIITRDNPALAKIAEAITAVATEKWGAKANDVLAQLKAAGKLPVHDGDAKANYEGYKGNLFLNASSKVRPLVINGDRSPLTATDGKIYSGCYVNAMVSFWAQDNQFGKRVNAALMGVQFFKDGERLAGGETASADDFEAIVPEKSPEAAKQGAASLF